MATYYDIFGQKVQYLSSDPSPVTTGQVWYNSTSNTAKFQGATATDTIASGGNLNTARNAGMSAGASINSAVYTAGQLGPGSNSNATENYDGSTWTTSTAYPSSPTEGQGNGPQTAAIFCSGDGNSDTNFYDGSTFSAQNPLISPFYYGGGMAGTQTSAVIAGGINPPPPVNTSQEFDGTSWSAGGNYNQQRYHGRMCGTSVSDGLLIGGELNPPTFSNVESYNGSAWTNETAMPSARATVFTSIQSPASGETVVMGGYTAPSGTYLSSIIKYDGAAWTTSPANLTSGLAKGGSAGTSSSALAFGGKTGLPALSSTNITNEFIGAGTPLTKTITTT